MNFNDVIGAIGVSITLFAYFANIVCLIKKDGVLYYLLNVIGAGLACYASILIHYVPFFILEGTWSLISLVALINTIKKPQIE